MVKGKDSLKVGNIFAANLILDGDFCRNLGNRFQVADTKYRQSGVFVTTGFENTENVQSNHCCTKRFFVIYCDGWASVSAFSERTSAKTRSREKC